MSVTKSTNNRSNLRYKPPAPLHALIDTDFASQEFTPTVSALIFDESFRGCGLVVLETAKLQVGDRLRVQVGKMPVLKAEVRWRKEIADNVIKIGVLFSE